MTQEMGQPHGLATSRDSALDNSTISNRRVKSDIRMDEDPVYQYRCPTYKNYKANRKGQKFNDKENRPMVFGNSKNSSYDNLAKYNEYKKAKANKISNKKKV